MSFHAFRDSYGVTSETVWEWVRLHRIRPVHKKGWHYFKPEQLERFRIGLAYELKKDGR